MSIVSSLFVALTIIFNKKLRAHPNMLIAYMSIANFGVILNILIWSIGTEDFVCYFG